MEKAEEKRPKVGVGVMIVKDGKILFGKRKGSHGEGAWSLPGGHLEFGESLEECAKREVMEETGLLVDGIKEVTFTNDIFTTEDKHYITLYVKAKLVSGKLELKEPEKCERWGWFKWDNLPKPLFLPIENLIKSGFKP